MKLHGMVMVGLVACGSHETSPAGPVGKTYDVRAHLPADVRSKAPSDDKATAHDQTYDVKGAKVKITWRTFDDGSNKYIVSYGWSVVTPAPSITVEGQGQLDPMNVGSDGGPVIEQEIVKLRWHDNSAAGEHWGDRSFEIDAAGNAKSNE
jgi:hypothetical protein